MPISVVCFSFSFINKKEKLYFLNKRENKSWKKAIKL